MISEGKIAYKFEREFERVFGLQENTFVSVNSGTSALHLALEVLGNKGKVLLPANTFVATGMAIRYAGCIPVFCDILPDGTIDPEDVRKKVTYDTVGVIGVNWAGKRCQVDELQKICDKGNLFFIIDGAQSLGMEVGGDITCFSFQATKHLTTGDGGGMWCRDLEDVRLAKELRWFGISKESRTGLLGEREYSLYQIGYKYHMNDLSASLGLANLWGIKDRLSWYKTLAEVYRQKLHPILPIHVHDSAFWAYPVWASNVTDFTEFCRERNIPCSNIHRGIDHNPIFGGMDYTLVGQREWEESVTHLPIHSGLSINDIDWICSEVNKYV